MPYSLSCFHPGQIAFYRWYSSIFPLGVFYAGEREHFTRRASYTNFSGRFFPSPPIFFTIAGSTPFWHQYLMQGREYYLLRFMHLVFRFSYFEPLAGFYSQLPVYTPSSIIVTKCLNSSHKQADTK